MRYYKLVIGGKVIDTSEDNPSALQISFDISINYRYLAANQSITLHNVLPQFWGQQKNLVGKTVQLFGGMTGGLPLEKKDQQGLILSGEIMRAIPMVQGTETSLQLFFRVASSASLVQPFIIKAGADMANAVQSALSVSGITASVDASASGILAKHNFTFNPANVSDLASELDKYGLILSTSANGYRITKTTVGSSGLPIKTIDYDDIIGQPCALDDTSVVFQTAMRADIIPSQRVKLPTIYINPNTSLVDVPYLSQTGVYWVREVRYIGDFRSINSAESWVTQYTCNVSE